jgi:YHS domain-containing protein
MARFVLILALSIVLSRMFWRLVDSFMQGLSGREPRRPQTPQRAVPMARDPVCGTFVVPERAVSLVDGRGRLFFCSAACRDTYRARTA